MRLPQRTHGVLLGFVTLIAGPVLTAALTAPAPLAPVARHTTADATPIEATVPLQPTVPRMVARAVPAPAPAPTPPPAPRAVVVSTPRPAPVAAAVPAPRSYPPGSVDAIIMAAAAQWGVDGAWMIRIASCESGERPNAYNPSGPFVGLYQFLPSTFRAHGGTDIYDPTQQAQITAFMLAHGGARSWPVCSRR